MINDIRQAKLVISCGLPGFREITLYRNEKKMTDKEKKEVLNALEDTRKIFNEGKLDEAQKRITAVIDTFTEDSPKKKDEKCIYLDFKTAMEESIYRNEEQTRELIRLPEIPMSNVYLISGSIAMEQKDYATALERLEEAMDWNPVSPEIAFEYAEVVKRMGSVDQFLDLTTRIFPHIYLGRQMAHAYRNFAYYYEAKHEPKKAIESFFFSLEYEDNEMVKKEINELGKQLKGDEKQINLAEFPKICQQDGLPYGPDKDVVQLAYANASFFKKENRPKEAFYFFSIVYELLKDPKVKKMVDEMRAAMDEKDKK